MTLIVILLLISLYLFWYFDKRRKLQNAEHGREKKEAFTRLLIQLRKEKEKAESTTKKTDVI